MSTPSDRVESYPLVSQGGSEGAHWHALVSSGYTTEEEDEAEIETVLTADSVEEEEKVQDTVFWKRHYTFSCGGLAHITGKVEMCGLTCTEDFILSAVEDAFEKTVSAKIALRAAQVYTSTLGFEINPEVLVEPDMTVLSFFKESPGSLLTHYSWGDLSNPEAHIPMVWICENTR